MDDMADQSSVYSLDDSIQHTKADDTGENQVEANESCPVMHACINRIMKVMILILLVVL